MNEQFYGLMPGAIGSVAYRWKSKQKISQSETDAYIDNSAREAMYAHMNRRMYNPGEELPPIESVFMNARAEARTRLQNHSCNTIIKRETLQVGNKECLDLVLKLQRDPDFAGWVDTMFINLYILETKKLLSNM